MVEYILKISMNIGTEAKKNTIKLSLQSTLSSAVTAGTIKNWSMSINPVIESTDAEEYNS